MEISIRVAKPEDAEIVCKFIDELAVYEREPEAVMATPAALRAQMENANPPFECLLVEVEGRPVGFALFYQKYSTWQGKPGMHLEDIFVREEYRGIGAGKALWKGLAQIVKDRGYPYIDFWILDWNEVSIRFHQSLGAMPLAEFSIWRIYREALRPIG